MKRHVSIIFALLLAACVACSAAQQKTAPTDASADAAPTNNATANGRSIFQTGRDMNGVQISARNKPLADRCAACHMTNGAGGKHFPDGAVSADLRHRALVAEQKHPYTLALLERAISTGVDNEGKPLDPVMPRWRLSKRDLNDVAHYVLTQLK